MLILDIACSNRKFSKINQEKSMSAVISLVNFHFECKICASAKRCMKAQQKEFSARNSGRRVLELKWQEVAHHTPESLLHFVVSRHSVCFFLSFTWNSVPDRSDTINRCDLIPQLFFLLEARYQRFYCNNNQAIGFEFNKNCTGRELYIIKIDWLIN